MKDYKMAQLLSMCKVLISTESYPKLKKCMKNVKNMDVK